MKRYCVSGAAVCALLSFANAGEATTMVSTDLSVLASFADGVVQGTVGQIVVQTDDRGVPWTLYTIAIEDVLVGTASEGELTFRCMGGQVGRNQVLEMVGAPTPEVGDTLVFLHGSGGLCDVAGLKHGMFWIKSDASGTRRLVNHEGRALAGFDQGGIVLSAELVGSAPGAGAETVSACGDLSAPASTCLPGFLDGVESVPPVAELEPLLQELAAFTAKFVTNPGEIRSANGVVDVPHFDAEPAPEGKQ